MPVQRLQHVGGLFILERVCASFVFHLKLERFAVLGGDKVRMVFDAHRDQRRDSILQRVPGILKVPSGQFPVGLNAVLAEGEGEKAG